MGRAGTGKGPAKGAGALWILLLQLPSVPKIPRPWEPVSLTVVSARSPGPRGVSSKVSGNTGPGAGSLAGLGLVLESRPLTCRRWPGRRSSAQGQGRAGQRGRRRAGSHLASSSGWLSGQRLGQSPPRGRPGDLEGQQAGGLTQGLGSTRRPPLLWVPSQQGKLGAQRGQGKAASRLPSHASTHHSRVRPLPLQPGLTGAGLRALQGCLSPPCHKGLLACQGETRKAHPIRERKALQSAVG